LSPQQWTDLKLPAYLAIEVFINPDRGSYNQSRIPAGLRASVHEQVKLAAYSVWLTVDRDVLWEDAHILGLSASFVF
jgi:hypothetical protein